MAQTNFNYDTLDESYFPSIADNLLNKCYLLVNDKEFRLVEIEFYLNCQGHVDPYTHGDVDQLKMHTFYFHKFKSGTYKAGTFKGMDLTFGDQNENAYFGILIRAIEETATNIIIEGPCNVVNKILNAYGCESIMDFTGGESLDIFGNDHNFVLVKSEALPQKEIFWGPRIGLSDKFPPYQNRYYRYVTDKNKIKKKKTTLVKVDVEDC